jgi:hypothetical protein
VVVVEDFFFKKKREAEGAGLGQNDIRSDLLFLLEPQTAYA